METANSTGITNSVVVESVEAYHALNQRNANMMKIVETTMKTFIAVMENALLLSVIQ